MVRAAPATIEEALRERINTILIARTSFGSVQDFEVKALIRDADKLAHADAHSASLVKAEVFSLCGDRQLFEYWLANAAKYRGGRELLRSQAVCLSNLGYFSEAAEAFEQVMDPEYGYVGQLFHVGLINCCFASMVKASDHARKADIPLDGDLVEIAKAGGAVLSRNGVNEAQVRQVIDVAGEVLREHNLLWYGDGPLVRTFSDDEDAGMLYQLFVGVTNEEAAQLTDEVLGRLIERQIDIPGFSFCFIAKLQ